MIVAGDTKMDRRLRRRLQAMTETAALRPQVSFPKIFTARKELEGAYDLFANENVTPEAILAEEVQKTVQRCRQRGEVLVAHDTTTISVEGEWRIGLGPVGTSNRSGQGFFAHVSLAIGGPADRRALGIVDAEFWVRPEKTRKDRNQSRKQITHGSDNEAAVWMAGVRAAEAALAGEASAIHLMDSAADGYAQLAEITTLGCRAIIRGRHDRVVEDAGKQMKISDALQQAEVLLVREIPLTMRRKNAVARHPARAARQATLNISATRVWIARPHRNEHVEAEQVAFNLVHVRETNAPDGEEPVDWRLLTNLPIETVEQVARVVDCYRARWVIEEFFKALKTGCSVELRQLETAHSLMNMTAFFLPIAARLLELRSLARDTPDLPATEVFSDEELETLRRIATPSIPSKPTVKNAMDAIAKLGGHLKSNGEPGWMVLSRGWMDVAQFLMLKRRYDASESSPE